MTDSTKQILRVQNIHTYYGLSHILFGISLEINEGEVLCLLGRNGAGKTTTMRSIAGFTPAKEGKVFFYGEDITALSANKIAKKGIITAFAEKRVFGNLTVKENLEIAQRDNPRKKDHEMWNLEKVYELFPVLQKYSKKWAKKLSGGEQQMLCIARALMSNPDLLLLDEPTIGLAPVVVDDIARQIRILQKEGMSILLAEQNFLFASELGVRCMIIDTGEIKYEGTFEELKANESIMKKYLTV
ncbi:MAG: ABC transporter ATP-binding protein [Desulfomonilia bacterium]|uniref:Leucine/isoleucine/valine transporter subunit ATP-binding component of ABC superfamily n=1 Tax=anaerobic digester metagenome TaxID=1263854 RepID=A0A485M408_9ZZZZ|nr:ABC transporter ATP-binding protein [Pseudomonadota bacterium]HRS54824.1 ABC transporter ATP-binding protein [Desulfomonilia bacterium]HRV34421.1 ABC transporter ATP-binding protein [Desulfomonilia bacterium]